MNKKESKEKIKREIPNYLLFDYEAVKAHLEKMAARGWRLVTAGTNVWKYRQAEPAKVKYAVTYAPDASVYDSEPTESQKTLADFCAREGWVKVSDWAQAQIFCSEEENPVPIETDEEIRLEVIKTAMKKNFIPSNVVLVIILAFNLWRVASGFFYNPLPCLSSWWMLLTLAFTFVAFPLVAADLAGYFIWVKKSEKSIANGGSCCGVKALRHINRWSIIVLIAYLLLYVASALQEGRSDIAKYMVFMLLGFTCLLVAVDKTREFMKNKGASRDGNKAVVVAVDVILAFALVAGARYFAFSGDDSGNAKDSYVPEVHSTFIAESISGQCADPKFSYEISEVKWEALADWCKKKAVEAEDGDWRWIRERENPQQWGADKVYEGGWYDDIDGKREYGKMDVVIMLKDNRIVRVWSIKGLTESETGQVMRILEDVACIS
ncbi:MAG: DUF2812 domain-containing protein [Anaerovoracaceae bacterium]